MGHITQLSQILNDNSDVIYEIDAGFIGEFGEWHDSRNGNDTKFAHNQVLTYEYTYFPGNRHVTVRRPAYKMNWCNCIAGSFVRVGHNNQRFWSEAELWIDPQGIQNTNDIQAFYENDVSFTANGGECNNMDNFNGNTARNRMRDRHYSIFIGTAGLISNWQTNYAVAYNEIKRRLGYRFRVMQATTPFTVVRGQNKTMTVKLIDDGFAKIMNKRNMYAVFNIGSSWAFSTAFTDPNGSDDLQDLRLADVNGKTYTGSFTIPTSFPTGTAQVYLWLPDHATTLQGNPLFSVQLDGPTWTTNLGANRLHLNTIQVQ